MITDRKNFDFRLDRGIIAKTEYPGVAELVPRHIWDVEIARSNRVTRTKNPLKSADCRGFCLFLVFCGAFPAQISCGYKVFAPSQIHGFVKTHRYYLEKPVVFCYDIFGMLSKNMALLSYCALC